MDEAYIVKIEKFPIKSQTSGFFEGHLQSCKLSPHFFREVMVQERRNSAAFRGISRSLPLAVASVCTHFPEHLGRCLFGDLWFLWKSQHILEMFVPS